MTAESAIGEVRERYGLADKPFLLSVSNPQPRKNIPLLIRSFYRVLRKLPSWGGNLVLVGNVKAGFGLNAIRDEIAKEPELSHRVIWAGGVSDEHLCYLYSSCQAFLFPSTLEGFGLPALEAMKCGAPVICSNTSSLPEVAGDAAIMIDPKDEVALANALVRGCLESGSSTRIGGAKPPPRGFIFLEGFRRQSGGSLRAGGECRAVAECPIKDRHRAERKTPFRNYSPYVQRNNQRCQGRISGERKSTR